MIAVALTIMLALIWSVFIGSIFTLLWNVAPSAAFGLPSVTWIQGVGIYLVSQLVLKPPTLDLTIGDQS